MSTLVPVTVKGDSSFDNALRKGVGLATLPTSDAFKEHASLKTVGQTDFLVYPLDDVPSENNASLSACGVDGKELHFLVSDLPALITLVAKVGQDGTVELPAGAEAQARKALTLSGYKKKVQDLKKAGKEVLTSLRERIPVTILTAASVIFPSLGSEWNGTTDKDDSHRAGRIAGWASLGLLIFTFIFSAFYKKNSEGEFELGDCSPKNCAYIVLRGFIGMLSFAAFALATFDLPVAHWNHTMGLKVAEQVLTNSTQTPPPEVQGTLSPQLLVSVKLVIAFFTLLLVIALESVIKCMKVEK